MEPFILDYYNDYPNIIEVIDKMNKEAQLLKLENDKLKMEILNISEKYSRELKEYKSINELKYLLLELGKDKKKKNLDVFKY